MTPVDGRPVDIDRLRALGDEGVALLLSDSTNAENRGTTPSEMTVGPSMREIIAKAPGRVIVTSFASQIHRLQQVIDAATANHRQVCVIGRSMVRNLNISRNLGYANVDEDLLIKPKALDSVLPHQVVVLCTGSQGEPRSALTRMAHGDHPALQVHPTDTVVMSSKAVPGNEVNVGETVNRLNRLGATVLTENNAYVHVSGHGSADELRTMLELVRPRFFVPVHGEYRMLRAHARIAEETGVEPHAVRIADNGTVLELDGEGLFVAGQIEAGMTLVDGYSVGDMREEVLRDRRRLATDGVLIVVATIATESAEVVAEPGGDRARLRGARRRRRGAGGRGPRRRRRCARPLPGQPHDRGQPAAAGTARRAGLAGAPDDRQAADGAAGRGGGLGGANGSGSA